MAGRRHEVMLERNAASRMRDGAVLYADVYRPKADGSFPIILMRLPYNKTWAVAGDYAHPSWYARHGYVVVVQDCRGRWTSEGEWNPFFNEGRDGYDTVEWADAQRPTHLVFDAQGRAYVSELGWQVGQVSQRHGRIEAERYGRVSVYEPDGRVLARWGSADACAPGSFAAPHGVAVDSHGDLYVSEVTWTVTVSRGRALEGCHAFQKFTLTS
jgi:hypothetical protein